MAVIVFVGLLLLAACGGGDQGRPTPPNGSNAQGGEATIGVLARDLDVPWGVAFLPDGDALVSERDSGRILRLPVGGGEPREAMRIEDAEPSDEAGLLGLAVSPTYERDGLVYACYTGSRDNRVVRFRLGGTAEPVVTGIAKAAIHDGGRIAFGPDRKLYIATGDATQSDVAQDPSRVNGKILRVEPDGSVPADNPFAGSPVWSLGHRNVQGLAWDADGRLWATEFGQNAFDEVNLIERGGNYGWPEVEGRGDTRGGRFINPQVTWSTAEASPSGAAIVDGALYVGALRGQRLWRVPLSRGRAGEPQPLLEGRFGRLRTVVAAPDGALWVTTSNRDGRGSPAEGDDRILRVAP